MLFRIQAVSGRQRLLRGAVLLAVLGLCGTFDILNNNIARWASRMASFPEEEEFHGKDRAALVASVQPSRRGVVRPNSHFAGLTTGQGQGLSHTISQSSPSGAGRPAMTGAGIFQHC